MFSCLVINSVYHFHSVILQQRNIVSAKRLRIKVLS